MEIECPDELTNRAMKGDFRPILHAIDIKKLSPNAFSSSLVTMLGIATAFNNKKAVLQLLKRGACPDIADLKSNVSPLHAIASVKFEQWV